MPYLVKKCAIPEQNASETKTYPVDSDLMQYKIILTAVGYRRARGTDLRRLVVGKTRVAPKLLEVDVQLKVLERA